MTQLPLPNPDGAGAKISDRAVTTTSVAWNKIALSRANIAPSHL
jgi:hypothetical protein